MKRMVMALAVVAVLTVGSLASARVVDGPVSAFGQFIEGDTYDTWAVFCYGGEYVEVAIDGDDSTDLDLALVDSEGNIIALDDLEGDFAYLKVYVPQGGEYAFVVINHGPGANVYDIVAE
jgi:hypothetical protein